MSQSTTALTPRPWPDVPLDTDGGLSLEAHQAVCVEPASCPFCLDDAAQGAERGATP